MTAAASRCLRGLSAVRGTVRVVLFAGRPGSRRPRPAARRRGTRSPVAPRAQAQEGSDALTRPRVRPSGTLRKLPDSLLWILEAITAAPALVVDSRLDLLAVNRLARAFRTDLYDSHIQPPNIARHHFLDPASRRFYPDGDTTAGPPGPPPRAPVSPCGRSPATDRSALRRMPRAVRAARTARDSPRSRLSVMARVSRFFPIVRSLLLCGDERRPVARIEPLLPD